VVGQVIEAELIKLQNTPTENNLLDEEVKVIQGNNKSCLVYNQIRVWSKLSGGDNSCTC